MAAFHLMVPKKLILKPNYIFSDTSPLRQFESENISICKSECALLSQCKALTYKHEESLCLLHEKTSADHFHLLQYDGSSNTEFWDLYQAENLKVR